jgi:hypothetical protein
MRTFHNDEKKKAYRIEHVYWLYEFQKESLALALPNMDMCVICSDTFEEISNFNLPRGKGRIAVAWKRELSPCFTLSNFEDFFLLSDAYVRRQFYLADS